VWAAIYNHEGHPTPPGRCEGVRSLHEDVEQLITLLGDFVLREGNDQLHRFRGPVDLLGSRGGVTERPSEPLADLNDLKAAFVTAKKNDLVSCEASHKPNPPLVNNRQAVNFRESNQ